MTIATAIISALDLALKFLAVWILLLLAWYALGLPIGPGVYPQLPG
ncbi:hypothetical protein [Pantoea sp. B65]